MAKEAEVCPIDGSLIVNPDMHTAYHAWVNDTITRMNAMLTIIWEDGKFDKDKKLEPLPPPPVIDY
jgi:hypothetical protein